jgi:hypothetical protein
MLGRKDGRTHTSRYRVETDFFFRTSLSLPLSTARRSDRSRPRTGRST